MNATAIPKSTRSRGSEYNEAAEYTTRGTTDALRPSGIRADHNENGRLLAYDTMPELVKYIGARCCFSPEQIEKRLASLLREGQITPVEHYVTATGQATLVDGYLRHCAFLLAEVGFAVPVTAVGWDGKQAFVTAIWEDRNERIDIQVHGEVSDDVLVTGPLTGAWVVDASNTATGSAQARGLLEQIPRAKGKILSIKIKQPKSSEDWAAVADRNLAENLEREALTDADMAVWIERRHAQLVRQFRKEDESLGEKKANGKATEAIAERLKWSVSTVAKYRRLAALKPSVLLAVHTGQIKMSQALRKASEAGEGTATGPRAGVPHKSIRLALKHADKRPLPTHGLSGLELKRLLAVLAGEADVDGSDDKVLAWVDAMSISADEAKALTPKTNGRKSPPKPGEHIEAEV